MLWSCSSLQYSTLIKQTTPLELGSLFNIFLSRLIEAILACNCVPFFFIKTHEFGDGWAVSGFSTERSVESTMRKCDIRSLCEIRSFTYTQYINGQTKSHFRKYPVSLWFGYFTLVQLFSSTEPGMPDQECHMNSTLS